MPNTDPFNSSDLSAAPSPPQGLRDWHVLEGVRDLLAATNEFDGVGLSELPETQGVGAGVIKLAIVSPLDWEEIDETDDEADVQDTIRVRFTLTLLVRIDDAALRDNETDRLLCVCKNALDGRPLVMRGGESATIPGWTKLRRGRWEKAVPPERRMTVLGESTYWIDGDDGHDEED